MKLSSVRELVELKKVLKDPNASGPDPAYWVFSEVDEKDWANLTVIAPGSYNGEYPKTFGHYHPEGAVDETYHVVKGDGVLLLQKKYIEGERLVEDRTDEVFLVRAKAGNEIVIPPQYGHSWSNIGKHPLLLYDNWRSGHTPVEYEPIEKMQGLAYYLIEENGQVKAVANPRYKNLPEAVWMSAEEFREKEK